MPLIKRTWIDHENSINADLDTVSELMRGIDDWASFTPGLDAIVRRSDDPPAVGTKFKMHMNMPGSPKITLPAEIYQWDRERLEWGGGMPGSVIRHSMEFSPDGEGACKLRHVEYATGILALIFLPFEKKAYRHDLGWSEAIAAHFA